MSRKALAQVTAWMSAGLFVVFAAVRPASAQTGWSANLFLQPFPSPYLSDWENNPSIGSLTVFNNTGTSEEVLLHLTITERSRGEIARGSSLPIIVPPTPPPTQINSDRFIDWGTVSYNKSIENQAIRSGRLPEGEYTACLRIEDRSGGTLVDQVCADFTIVYPDQPQLILPADGEQVDFPYPIFTWTPLQVPIGYQIHYELRIAEVLPGQTPQRALEANIPQLETDNLLTTSVQYPISALPLERGKQYAWQIQALDQNGFAPSSNQGRSEIWTFLYQGSAGEGDAIVTVIDSSGGEPIPSVSVLSDGSALQLTDQDGRVFLRNMPVGTIDMIIQREGYRTQSVSVAIAEGTTSRLTVALSRIPDRVSGTVRDFYTDRPVDSVRVGYKVLRYQGGSITEGPDLLETHSGQNGSFEFADVPDDEFFLITLTREGYAVSRGAVLPRSLTGIKKTIVIVTLRARYPELQILAGPLRCAMVMKPTTAVVEGKVVSEAGDRPIPGAIVEIWKKGTGSPGQGDQGIASVRTDSTGRFRIDGITPGSVYFFRIFVSRRFHPYDTKGNPISVARAGIIESGVHRLRMLRGTVSGVVQALGAGTPLAGADVIILPQDSLLEQLVPDTSNWAAQTQPISRLVDPVRTDSLGRFSFTGLPINDPGHPTDRYAVWTRPAGHDAVWESVRIGDDGEHMMVTLRAPVARGSIVGTITSTGDGRGVGDAVIEVVRSRAGAEDLPGGNRQGVSYSNSDGSFTVTDLDLGEPYTISVRKAGFETSTPEEQILLSESERTRTVNLTLSPFRGIVRGSVRDPAGGPLFDVVITSPAAPELNASSFADGTFEIPNAPAIRLPLLFQLPGYRDVRDTVAVTPDDTAIVHVVMEEYSGALVAWLTDSTSQQPVRNAMVFASASLREVSDDSGPVAGGAGNDTLRQHRLQDHVGCCDDRSQRHDAHADQSTPGWTYLGNRAIR
jgi:Carboxypeptidase regulatory-like domain